MGSVAAERPLRYGEPAKHNLSLVTVMDNGLRLDGHTPIELDMVKSLARLEAGQEHQRQRDDLFWAKDWPGLTTQITRLNEKVESMEPFFALIPHLVKTTESLDKRVASLEQGRAQLRLIAAVVLAAISGVGVALVKVFN